MGMIEALQKALFDERDKYNSQGRTHPVFIIHISPSCLMDVKCSPAFNQRYKPKDRDLLFGYMYKVVHDQDEPFIIKPE